MSPHEQEELSAILRQDFEAFARKVFTTINPGTSFVSGPHIRLVAEWLTYLRDETQYRMIINLPPRHLKSVLGSIALPAWLLGHNPSLQIICASYSAEFANKLSRDCRIVMESRWYQHIFPNTRLARVAAHELTTTKRGCRMATSVDGVLTGRGADLIIIDDPLKPDEAQSDAQRVHVNEWFDGTVYSRLNDKQNGNILLIMQRLHENDLTGHLMAKGGWEQLVLPAIADANEYETTITKTGFFRYKRKVGEALHPARESLATLEEIRRTIGEYNFAGQYQQRPAPREGGIVKRAWFKKYTEAEQPPKFDMVLQSWDTANKSGERSDFSVCTSWGLIDKKFYLLNVLRKKLNYPELKRAVREQAEWFKADVVLVEDKGSGIQLIQELAADGMHSIKAYQPGGLHKVLRMEAQTGAIENGFVYLPTEAEWLQSYLHEMTTFPAGAHDDQVDSTAQALHWAATQRKPTPGLILWMEQECEKEKRQQATAEQVMVPVRYNFC